jgi:hypothetical protein
MTDFEKEEYLSTGGWLQNNSGWWHPPSCLASWPLDEAVKMAKSDEKRGRRMSPEKVEVYLKGL